MRLYAFLGINALLVVLAVGALSFAILKYRAGWRAAALEADRLRGKLVDYAETGFYKAANAALGPPSSKTARVIFIGDSITQRWNLSKSQLSYEAINRGIGSQTTAEMLVRFRPDAIDLKPAAIVILGGINDFYPGFGPLRLSTTQNNIRSMVELARLHGIAVVIGTVPPLCPERTATNEPLDTTEGSRQQFNDWLRTYCDGQLCHFADFDTALSNHGACDCLSDAVHPNERGYAIMTEVVREALQRALQMPPTT